MMHRYGFNVFLVFSCAFFCFSMKKEDTQEKEAENYLQENFVHSFYWLLIVLNVFCAVFDF